MRDGRVSRSVRWVVAAAVLAGYVPLTACGCFGTFQLTRKVYGFNKDVSPDKWVRWLAFIVMNVVPVYGFATLFDAVIANSIEFWTGENPVVAGTESDKMLFGPYGEVGHFQVIGPGRADLEIIDAAGRWTALELVREEASIAAYDPSGRLVMRVGDRDGRAALLAHAAD